MPTLCEKCAPLNERLHIKEQELLLKEQHLREWELKLMIKEQELQGDAIHSPKEKKAKINNDDSQTVVGVSYSIPWANVASTLPPRTVLALSQVNHHLHATLKYFIEHNFQFSIPMVAQLIQLKTLNPKKAIGKLSVDLQHSTVTHFTTEDQFDHPIDGYPPRLTHLSLGNSFCYPLGILPQTLSHLTVGAMFNEPVEDLPSSLTSFTVRCNNYGSRFNQPVTKMPRNLTCLATGDEFNCEVDSLPPSLTNLTFGVQFQHTVDSLPSMLASLELGYLFNHPINDLPASLKSLTTGDSFNQPVDHLPSGITYITFGNSFNQLVDHLPTSLTHLNFDGSFDRPVNHLPSNLTHLRFGRDFNQQLNSLPASVTHLTLGYYFNQPIPNLPARLTSLTLGLNFNQLIENLPHSLTYLYISYNFSQPVRTLPQALKHLVLERSFIKDGLFYADSFDHESLFAIKNSERLDSFQMHSMLPDISFIQTFECGRSLFEEFGLKFKDMVTTPKGIALGIYKTKCIVDLLLLVVGVLNGSIWLRRQEARRMLFTDNKDQEEYPGEWIDTGCTSRSELERAGIAIIGKKADCPKSSNFK